MEPRSQTGGVTVILYQAESLADIARHFEQMAGKAATRAGLTTGIQKKLLDREAVIWGQAASTLRQTTFKQEMADIDAALRRGAEIGNMVVGAPVNVTCRDCDGIGWHGTPERPRYCKACDGRGHVPATDAQARILLRERDQ